MDNRFAVKAYVRCDAVPLFVFYSASPFIYDHDAQWPHQNASIIHPTLLHWHFGRRTACEHIVHIGHNHRRIIIAGQTYRSLTIIKWGYTG